MTELDKALVELRANPQDQKAQSGFYDLFLNTSFFVPTANETFINGEGKEETVNVPLLIDSEGTDYLVFFDEQQRLNDWAEQEAAHMRVPGHVLAEMTSEKIQWVLNVGSDYAKPFAPDEIAWLKDVVATCKAEDAKAEAAKAEG